LFASLLAVGAAHAQHVPPSQPGVPPMPAPPLAAGVLSPELLATIPDLTPAQQTEVRKILLQRRDAHDAARAKERAEREAQMTRSRAEHERIDDESGARLRKLLGEDGYRNLARWLLPPRRGAGPGMLRGPRGPGSVSGPPPIAGAEPHAAQDDVDDDDEMPANAR